MARPPSPRPHPCLWGAQSAPLWWAGSPQVPAHLLDGVALAWFLETAVNVDQLILMFPLSLQEIQCLPTEEWSLLSPLPNTQGALLTSPCVSVNPHIH